MNDSFLELQTHLHTVQCRIRQKREILARGANVSLSDLNELVMNTCASVRVEMDSSNTTKVSRAALAQKLEYILADLDELKEEVVRHHAAIGGKIDTRDGGSR